MGLGNKNKHKYAVKLLKEQEASQQRINESLGLMNYEYGEQAADAAHGRSLDLLRAETEANSWESQVADAQNAGLSVGLLYGGGGGGGTGGSAGGGAQGDGAGNQRAQAPNYLDILAADSQRKIANAEVARAGREAGLFGAEAQKTIAETQQIKAETERTQEETETSRTLTPYQEKQLEKLIEEKELENLRKVWENESGTFTEKAGLEILKLQGEIGETEERALATKAQRILTESKAEGYWQELLNATKTANAAEVNAAANKLSAEVSEKAESNPGNLTNTKTWIKLAKDLINSNKELDENTKNAIKRTKTAKKIL